MLIRPPHPPTSNKPHPPHPTLSPPYPTPPHHIRHRHTPTNPPPPHHIHRTLPYPNPPPWAGRCRGRGGRGWSAAGTAAPPARALAAAPGVVVCCFGRVGIGVGVGRRAGSAWTEHTESVNRSAGQSISQSAGRSAVHTQSSPQPAQHTPAEGTQTHHLPQHVLLVVHPSSSSSLSPCLASLLYAPHPALDASTAAPTAAAAARSWWLLMRPPPPASCALGWQVVWVGDDGIDDEHTLSHQRLERIEPHARIPRNHTRCPRDRSIDPTSNQAA